MIRLALLRHFPTAWNREGRLQGRTDLPLDPEARAALAGLALPAAWAGADLVASPLSRAAETAAILAGRAPRTDPALIEMHWGAWEGARGADLRADPASGWRDLEHWGWDWRPPGGESPAEVRARLLPFLAGLRHDTVAVTHIGVIRTVLAMAHGWNFNGPPPFRVKRGRLFAVAFAPGDPSAMMPEATVERLVAGDAPCA
jgi:probable phosphoglycerate mutase